MIYNASGATCQLDNFCFEYMTLYTHFSALKYSKYTGSYCWQWEWIGRCRENGNANEVLDCEWE